MRDLGFTTSEEGAVTFSFGNPSFDVRGLALLKQRVLVELLSEQRPGFGAGVPQLLEDNFNQPDNTVQLLILEAVRLAEDHIKANTAPAAPKSERLDRLDLTRVENGGLGWAIDVEIYAVSGESTSVSLS